MRYSAYIHGFHEGYLIGSTFGIVAALIATFVIKQQKVKKDISPADMMGA